MKPDYIKATQDLLTRLRRPTPAPKPLEVPSNLPTGFDANMVIYAPKDCVIYITPQPPAPPGGNRKTEG